MIIYCKTLCFPYRWFLGDNKEIDSEFTISPQPQAGIKIQVTREDNNREYR